MELYKQKTKIETGYDFVLGSLILSTPFGRKRLKALGAFMPGQEEALKAELCCLDDTVKLTKALPNIKEDLRKVLSEVKDNSFTIERSLGGVLSMVELFEIKYLLLKMRGISEVLDQAVKQGAQVPGSFFLTDLTQLLDRLDPERERMSNFYIYDSFSAELASLRREKKKIEIKIKSLKKAKKEAIEKEYGITLTPGFEYLVSKMDEDNLKIAATVSDLVLKEEDLMAAIYTVKPIEGQEEMSREIERLVGDIEAEESSIREKLSKAIGQSKDTLLENCTAIGWLDFNLAKADFAIENNCVKPEIANEHLIEIRDGRQLEVEHALKKQNKGYCPVSIKLATGVTCITGANMGGKTISLKMVGQCAILGQTGFFVPAKSATIGLSSGVQILVGDNQSVKKGLSSFGGEMEELKDMLEKSRERALLLIDEIAVGTNPAEGWALTKSLVKYLSEKPYISLLTTHYSGVTEGVQVQNLQVRGLAGADFSKLSVRIKTAGPGERVDLIGEYMDYRLAAVSGAGEIPRDALRIGEILGLPHDITEAAKKYMEDRKDEK